MQCFIVVIDVRVFFFFLGYRSSGGSTGHGNSSSGNNLSNSGNSDSESGSPSQSEV